ncbi:MAG: response regulator [Thermoanaerobaculia bacterium]
MPARILVIEDDEPVRILISRVLTRQGHHVDIAENGAVGVDRIKESTYEVIILDFMMPVMDGLQLLEWIKRERPAAAKE